MSISPCDGARKYLEYVAAHSDVVEIHDPVKVTLSKGTVVACLFYIEGMCAGHPYAKNGSPSIPYPGVERAICDGPNTEKS